MEETLSWDEVPRFMEEVRWMARDLLRRERHAESLQTTALVLTALRRQKRADQDWSEVTWQNRQHFFAAVYRAMGRALIDHARKRIVQERATGPVVRLEALQLAALPQAVEEEPEQVVALGEALEQLKKEQPEWAEVIEHRYYGGLTIEDTAHAMGKSEATVKRWRTSAWVWLYEEIRRRLQAAEEPGGC
jgi:RNA polymerase sigma factor (TIGR02999 family)